MAARYSSVRLLSGLLVPVCTWAAVGKSARALSCACFRSSSCCLACLALLSSCRVWAEAAAILAKIASIFFFSSSFFLSAWALSSDWRWRSFSSCSFLACSAFSAASSTTRSWSTVSGCFGGGGSWLTAGFSGGGGVGGVTLGGGGTVLGTGLTLTAFGGGLPVGPIRVASMMGPCSCSGLEQVIGFIHVGRCNASKKFS